MDFTNKDIKNLIELYSWNIPDFFNYESLSNFFQMKSSNPRFIRIKKWLLKKKIIEEKAKVGNSHLLQLDKKKLKETIPEIDFIRFLHDKFIKEIWNFNSLWKYS